MNIPDSAAWALPSKAAFDKLLKVIAQQFEVRHQAGKVKRVEVLDNFDWGLWHAGVSLAKVATRHYLLVDGKRELTVTAVKSPARFWWDFPAGECQAVLQQKSPLRALLPIATVRFAVHRYELLNNDEKIVVRLKLIQHYSAESQQSRKIIGIYLEAIPLIGYQESYKKTVALIEQGKFTPSSLPGVSQLLLSQGVQVKAKAEKRFGLTDAMPAEAAVRLMGLKILHVAEEQRQGLLQDTDTEFLHQYRVHLRKLRSLVTLLKRCLAPEKQAVLKSLLLRVFAPTSRLRDLDVFLLDRPRYEVLVPPEFCDGLDELFQHIAKERQQCQKTLVHKLRTKVYLDDMAKITALLSADPDFKGEQSRQPVKTLAQKRIVARYRKVCKAGKAIDDNTPDEEVHQLRIECKKLRYLMEFFAELFPKKTMKTLVRQVKDLQDILGRFNDYSVQQTFLMQVATREKSKSVLAAIHGLVAVLHQRQREARLSVSQAVAQFAGVKTAEALADLSARVKK